MKKAEKKTERQDNREPFINHHYQDDVLIIKLNNILFMHNILQLESIWKNAFETKTVKIIAVDCSKLELIDSTAIGTLVKLLNETIKHNIKLIMFNMKSTIENLFETAKLTDFFIIMTKQQFDTFLSERKTNN